MLPHSVVTISVVTALLPSLSKFAHEKKLSDIHDQLVKAMRLVGIITIPSSIAFLFFGPLITQTLFFGISKADGQYLGFVLSAFALGLAPMSLNLIALRGLNAFENVKLQVLSNAIMNAVAAALSVALALALPAKWVTVGLAAALSISYFVGAWLTTRMLKRYEVRIHLGEVVGFYLKLALFSLVTAVPLWLLENQLPDGNTLRLVVVLGVGGLGYLVLAKVFKVDEITNIFELISKKRKGR
jgi:putative peptidoglycan lipid II flippase